MASLVKGAVMVAWLFLMVLPFLVVAAFMLCLMLPMVVLEAVQRWFNRWYDTLWAGW